MFLLSNLDAHGVGIGDHRNSTDYFLWDAPDTGAVFGLTKGGWLLGLAPDAQPEVFAGFAAAIAGREVVGMTGEDSCVRATLAACGCGDGLFARSTNDPLYRMELAGLADPKADLRPVTEADGAYLAGWLATYLTETNSLAEGADAAATGQAHARAAISSSMRVMFEDGQPVAMASISAEVGAMVQLGGVFVPPELRQKGLGGHVTLARLAEARAHGAETAILFSANAAASKVYERVGFKQIGHYRVAVLAQPFTVPPKEGNA